MSALVPKLGFPWEARRTWLGYIWDFEGDVIGHSTSRTCPTDIPFLPTGWLQDIIGMSTGQPHERNFGGRKLRTEKLLSISILEFVHCRYVDVLGSCKFSNCLHPGSNLGPSDLLLVTLTTGLSSHVDIDEYCTRPFMLRRLFLKKNTFVCVWIPHWDHGLDIVLELWNRPRRFSFPILPRLVIYVMWIF